MTSLSLLVENAAARPDAIPLVSLSGARPLDLLRIEASFTDDDGTVWRSHVKMYTDCFGKASSAGTASQGGTYRDLDPAGLFWSMIPAEAETASTLEERYRLFPSGQPVFSDPYRVIKLAFSAHDGADAIAQATYDKPQIAPGIDIAEIDDGGLRGAYYAPKSPIAREGVIVMGGSGGGLDRYWARNVASLGYRVLNLAYFNYPGLPDNLAGLPLEYFKKAIDWMKQQTGAGRVAIQGASRGGELALILASTWPDDIACVASYVPMHLPISGLAPGSNEQVASWTLRGEDKPFAPVYVPTAEMCRERGISLDRGIPVAPFYLESLKAAESDERVWIPVEQAKAPILLVSASDDTIWPCSYGAERILERNKNHGGKASIEHLRLEGAGHITPPPGTITSLSTSLYHQHARQLIAVGGSPSVNARAGTKAWRRVINFYAEHLK